MKKAILVTAMVLVLGGLIAQLHVAAQTYHPVVQVESAEGLRYTAILAAVDRSRACAAASHEFLEPLKADCPACRIVYARCTRDLDELDAGMATPAAQASWLVEMPGVSIAIDGASEKARRTCQLMASDVAKRGVPAARCVAAGSPAPRS